MRKNLPSLLILLIVIMAVALGIMYERMRQAKEDASKHEESALSTGQFREVMKVVSLEVPATAFVARGEIIPPDSLQDQIADTLAGPNKKQIILLVKGALEFGIDLDNPPGFTVTRFPDQKRVVIDVPTPNFLHVADQNTETLFQWGGIDADDFNAAKNKATLLIRREGENPYYVGIAKNICANQLKGFAKAFGYEAEIRWHNPLQIVEKMATH